MSDNEQCGVIKNDGEPCTYSAKYDDGKCGIHSDHADNPPGGRESKFEDVKDDLLEAANSFKNHKQIANSGGIHRDTLYKYLDEHEQFSDSFRRERERACERLIQRGLDPNDEIDMQFVRFLLERSFKFIKTEKREHEHAGKDGGPIKVKIGGDGK